MTALSRPRALAVAALVAALTVGCASRDVRPDNTGAGPSSTTAPDGGRTGTPAGALPDAVAYATQAAREASLAAASDWRLRGRVAFASDGDGTTVQIDWTQRGEAYDIRLVAPITGRSVVLRGGAEGAELLGLDGGPRRADDPEALLFEATGWTLPVRQFPRWARGARGPGPAQGLVLDADGRPQGWAQAGWTLRYPDWWPGDPPLPRRVFAERDVASVRLVIAEWSTPE